MPQMIASRRLILREVDQADIPVLIEIEAPQQTVHGDFGCLVNISGIADTPANVRGVDSFQAVELAFRYVAITLNGEGKNKSLCWPNGDTYQ
jgi:hypothetical protein